MPHEKKDEPMTNKSPASESKMIRDLLAMREEDIDTADIPEASAENRRLAKFARDFRPLKHSVTIRLDADILAWFKEHAKGGKYQTEMNLALRRHMQAASKDEAAE